MQEIQIETNIEPPKRSSKLVYPFDKLEVSTSIVVPDKKLKSALRSAYQYFNNKGETISLTYRDADKRGYKRIWRIK